MDFHTWATVALDAFAQHLFEFGASV